MGAECGNVGGGIGARARPMALVNLDHFIMMLMPVMALMRAGTFHRAGFRGQRR